MIKIINKSNEKLSFLADMPASMANAIRRSVNEVPVLAVDTLDISKNDSALYDEIIAHRVGLIPLKNEKLKSDCDCGKEDGCGKCSIKLKLKAEGPATVYSDELSPKGSNVYKMPITILNEGQELEFVATAKLGKGIEHAKFTPGLLVYRYSDDVEKTGTDDDDDNFGKVLEESKKNEKKELVISIESWGQMSSKEIFIEAVEALNENLKEFLKKVK